MAKASLEPIYERLHGANGYHPFNAQTFADWSIEAGDTVTIKRGNESYNSPIHVSRMVWKGTPQVNLEATGHRNRDPIARMSLKKYGRGGSGLRNSREMYLFAHDMYDEDGILHASIYATVESFHMAYENLESSLRGEIVVTASNLTSAFEDTANSLRSEITQTASNLTSAFEDTANSLRSTIRQTASDLTSAFEDSANSLRGEIRQTASELTSAFEDSANSLRSTIRQTASDLTSAFEDSANSLRSEITQTASNLTSAFEDTANSLRSTIRQTASDLTSAFEDSANSLRSEIQQTASHLTSAFEDSANSLRSQIMQTASSLTSAFEDSANSLRSSIQQTANRVALVVDGNGIKAAQIVAAVNNSGSSVLLSADHVQISGSTTINDVMEISDNRIYIKKPMRIAGNVLAESLTLRYMTDSDTLTQADLAGVIKSASVSGNTLTLVPVHGNAITFSKATSLSGEWGSSKLTVTATPQNEKYERTLVAKIGLATWTDTTVSVPVYAQWGSSGQYEEDTTFNTFVDFTTKVNGGKNNVKVTGPTWTTTPSANITGNSNTATFTTDAPNPGSGTSKSLSLYLSRSDSWSNNVRYVYVSHTDSSAANRVARIDVDASGIYTNGQNATKVSGPTWTTTPSANITGNSNTATFTTDAPSPASGASKSLALYLSRSDSWSNNVRYVYVSHTDSSAANRVARIDVDASSIYTNGRNATKVSGPTWNTTPASNITGNSNTATFTTDAPSPVSGAAKSLALYLSRSDSWSNNVRYVYVSHTDSSAANRIARIDVDASSIYTNGRNATKVSGPTWNTTPASNITGNSNTATFTTDADSPVSGAAKSLALYMSQGSWSSNKKYVYVTHTNSTDANRIARIEVDASTLVSNATTAGKNSAKVTGPTWSTTPASNITGNSNTATFTTDADSPVSGAAKSLALYMSQGSWSSNKKYVYVTHTNSTDANRIARVEVDASTLVTNATYAGKAAVTLNDPTWNSVTTVGASRTVTVSTTGRTNTSGTTDNLSKSVALFLTQGSWSSNKLTVSMRTVSTSGTVYAQTTVDAGTLVTNATNAGKAAVTLQDPTWNSISGSTPANRTVTVSTTGRTNTSGTTDNLSKSVALYLTQSSSFNSSHEKTVYMRTGSTSGTVYAQTTVDASSEYSAGQLNTRNSVSTVPVTLSGNVVYDGSSNKYMQSGTATVTFSNGQTQVTGIDCWGGVDVTGAYNSGRNAVSINNPTWTTTPASNITGNSNTATFKTNAPTQSSKSLSLYLSRSDSWSNNIRYVYVSHTDSSAANRVARIDVDASGIYTNGQQNAWDSLYRVPVELSGGIAYDGNTHKYMQHGDAYVQFNNGQSEKTVDCWGGVDVTDAYSAGWNAARNASEVPTAQNLNATSVTVKRPSPTVGGGSTGYTYALNVTNDYAQLKYGTTVICQVPLSAQPSATISAAYVTLSGEPVPNSSGGQSMSGSVSITYSNGTTTSHNCDGGVDVTVAYNAGKAQNPSYAHSATLTRYRAGAVESIVPGIMYRKESNGTYTALGSSSTYWYASSTNMGSSKVVAYN